MIKDIIAKLTPEVKEKQNRLLEMASENYRLKPKDWKKHNMNISQEITQLFK